MKIVHIITSLGTGGAEKLIVDLLPLLKHDGMDVSLVVMNPERTPFYLLLEKTGISIINMKWLKSYYNPLYILKFLGIMRKFDIVHVHLTAPLLFAAISKIFCSVPLCVTEHSTYNRRRRYFFLRKFDKWVYNQCDVIACISEATRVSLIDYLGGTKSNIITIENGIDIKRYSSAKPIIYKEQSLRCILVMVGGLREEKDQDTLIKALSLLPRNAFELWIVGDGPRRNELEKLTSQLQLDDEIKFWGNRFDVPELLKTSDIVIMSSHWEGFGLAALEGMAAGKPLIASDVNGLSSIVNNYGLLFNPGEVSDLANKILRLYTDKNLYDSIALKCVNRSLDFDISMTKEKYEEMYNELCCHHTS